MTFALIAIGITATAVRRGDCWAWWALLVGNTIAFGAPMTYDWIVGAIGRFEMLELTHSDPVTGRGSKSDDTRR